MRIGSRRRVVEGAAIIPAAVVVRCGARMLVVVLVRFRVTMDTAKCRKVESVPKFFELFQRLLRTKCRKVESVP